MMLDSKKELVVSDAGPLIQLTISGHLHILPRLYRIVIPDEVFEETQFYNDLPDAIEIAKAARSWLVVKPVKDRSKVRRLTRNQKLGKGKLRPSFSAMS
jgi:predicted nucleic acid-binding protein